jgi:hypothetical protein
MKANPIIDDLDQQIRKEYTSLIKGPVARIANVYDTGSDRLIGLVQKLNYESCTILTSDGWKRKCGGAPRGGHVILRLDPNAKEKAGVLKPYHFSYKVLRYKLSDILAIEERAGKVD